MWKAGSYKGRPRWTCRVKERKRNEERIRVGNGRFGGFVGRAHQFRATKTQVKDFINGLRRDANGTSV